MLDDLVKLFIIMSIAIGGLYAINIKLSSAGQRSAQAVVLYEEVTELLEESVTLDADTIDGIHSSELYTTPSEGRSEACRKLCPLELRPEQ